MRQAFLIDGTAFSYRAFYGVRNLSTSTGRPVNAIYGFAVMLGALRKTEHPDYLAVAFDAGKPTFRHERYDQYKVQRKPMPDPLITQLPIIKDLLRHYRIPIFELPGYEAEDLLATVARQIEAPDLEVFLVTGDKDALQLVGPRVKVYNPDHTKQLVMDTDAVVDRYGVPPERVVDLMALMGDDIDNIPGVPGIGEKTASTLLKRFGSLEALYGRLDELESGSLRESLTKHREQVGLARELATIDTHVPVEAALDQLRVAEPDWAALKRLFRELEFKKLASDIEAEAPSPQTASVMVHRLDEQGGAPDELLKALESSQPASLVLYRATQAESSSDNLFSSANGHATTQWLALAWEPNEAWIIGLPLWPDRLSKWLADPSKPKLGHDVKALYRALEALGLTLEGVIGDTMLAAYLARPSSANPHLNELAEEHLERRVPPLDPADTLTPAVEQALAQHAATVLEVHERLSACLAQCDLTKLYQDLELPLARVLAQMESTGIALDRAWLSTLHDQMSANLARLTRELYDLAGIEFNLNSPKQLSEVLFQRLQLPVIKRTKTGASTDSEVLQRLASAHPLPQKLLEYRELSKLVSTYVDALPQLIHPATGRVHTSFNQTGTATGRLSSSEPNLQNIPIKTELGRSIRKAFVPGRPGWVLIAADYSQIELRLLAHLSQDPGLIAAFKEDRDIHRHTASLVYGVPEAEVTPTMRSSMKSINFGIIYGMSAHGLARELSLSHEEATSFIEAYFARYAGIRRYLDTQIAQAKQQGFVQTLLGRRRYIPEMQSADPMVRQFGERMAVNAPIQGAAADLIKLAMVRLTPALREAKLSAALLLQVHDELVLESPPEELDALIVLLRQTMEQAIELAVPVRVTIKAGPNWLEMTETT